MDKMNDVLIILDELVSPENLELGDPQMKLFVDRLTCIYQDPDFRHSYHEIATHLEEQMDPDQRDALEEQIDNILNYADKLPGLEHDILVRIGKLADHISLETIRMARMEKIKYIGEKASQELATAQKIVAENESEVNELKKNVGEFHSQSITILGIFAGLVIGFATGTNLLTESFKNIDDLNFYKMMIYIGFVGFILFNIIFILLYMISKISGHSVSTSCKNKDCVKCGQCKHFWKKLRIKYPYICWFNIFAIAFIILIYLAGINNWLKL